MSAFPSIEFIAIQPPMRPEYFFTEEAYLANLRTLFRQADARSGPLSGRVDRGID